MLHIYTTSRTTRALHRFASLLNQSLAVALFGLLLALPVLYFVGVTA